MSSNPIPQGNYIPAVRFGSLIYTAGMTPRDNGVLICTGQVKTDDAIETYRTAVQQAAKNALTAAQNCLHDGEAISQILSITVYVNAEHGYTKHAKFADFASDYFYHTLGSAGIGCRASIGVASLPGDAPCEIQIIAAAGEMQK